MKHHPKHNGISIEPSVPVDCQWGDWSEYSACSETCGDGTKTRWRNKAVHAKNGGEECSGQSQETVTCNNGLCPGKI